MRVFPRTRQNSKILKFVSRLFVKFILLVLQSKMPAPFKGSNSQEQQAGKREKSSQERTTYYLLIVMFRSVLCQLSPDEDLYQG